MTSANQGLRSGLDVVLGEVVGVDAPRRAPDAERREGPEGSESELDPGRQPPQCLTACRLGPGGGRVQAVGAREWRQGRGEFDGQQW